MSTFPLSPSRRTGNVLYISGQIGQQNGALVADDIAGQTAQAVANIESILKDNGLTLADVVDVTAFLVNQENYDAFNEAYRNAFTEPYPTHTTVTVQSLPLAAKIELKAIALIQ
jgi:2-iminobutanoate/2-iminopropanoate deaminase